ncbi:MAG: DUF1924 domain-containing protein [Sulfurovaceae bacterium]|nr:DUF1924 domain-containing protein [Sulfurovaceae bacterium]
MKKYILGMTLCVISINAGGFNPPMQAYINTLKTQAKQADTGFSDFDAKRGEKIFLSKHIGKRGTEVSCASCHSQNLTSAGKNPVTNKSIKPLAPSANPSRLTEVAEVQKWLKRNFNDVYKREGTAQEKGDVLYYIKSK